MKGYNEDLIYIKFESKFGWDTIINYQITNWPFHTYLTDAEDTNSMCRCCDLAGGAVASDFRDFWFKSRHRPNLMQKVFLLTVEQTYLDKVKKLGPGLTVKSD